MNRYLFAGVLGCMCLALTLVEGGKLSEAEGYFFEHRPRLGHFKDKPFTELYQRYATAFVKPNFPNRAADDYRNYLPSGDECVVFFRKFRVNSYDLRDVDEFVVLDACLGYLYESTYHEADKEKSQFVADNLQGLIDDTNLQALYHGTQVNAMSAEAKECVGDLFLYAIQAKKQFPELVCNNHWIDLFTKFAECQGSIPREARAEDSYLEFIYKMVKRRTEECFENEIRLLNEATRLHYLNNPFRHIKNKVTAPISSLNGQASKRFLPPAIKKVLTVVQGTKKEVNYHEIASINRGIALKERNFEQRFLNNVANYATKKLQPKSGSKDNGADPTGATRYSELIDKMCNFFRPSDNPGYFDFSTPFLRMIRLTKYPDVFGITEKHFIDKVLHHAWETAPLYLSVWSCNVLSFTEGAFDIKSPNGKMAYKVVFKPNLSSMVVWPFAGFH